MKSSRRRRAARGRLSRRNCCQGDRQPVWSVVELVEDLVGGFFELERGEGRLEIVRQQPSTLASCLDVGAQEGLADAGIPLLGAPRT